MAYIIDDRFDALIPSEMADKAELIGVRKAHMSTGNMFILAILAGAFIALGAIFATTVAAGCANLPYGIVRLLSGLAFSLGLILVVCAGSELFTGNNLIVMAWASRKVGSGLLLKNWVIVFLGNFVGAFATVIIMFESRQYLFGKGAVGLTALTTADGKTNLGFVQAIALGIMCNALVCLAVWLTFGGRSITDRILAIIPPITAFVAAGFEHSVANMYFIPMGLFIKGYAPASFWTTIGKTSADFPHLTWKHFFVNNLLPVTIGNIIGGAVLVGAVYWFVYHRNAKAHAAVSETPDLPVAGGTVLGG